MTKIKKYREFNEEANWKSLAAGVISLLATSCSNVDLYDRSGNEIKITGDYESSGKVSKIDTIANVGFRYNIQDDKGNKAVVELDNDVISVGDSVGISIEYGNAKLIMKEEDCKNPNKCFPLPHNHIIGDSRENPEF